MNASDTASPPPPTTEIDWAFVRPWIELLANSHITHHTTGGTSDDKPCVDSDAVRIGRDPANDFWLLVTLDRANALRQHVEGERAALQELREAVILVHLFTSVQYELWYEWVVDSKVVNLPLWLHKSATNKIHLRYAFEFSEPHATSEFLPWDGLVFSLLGVTRMAMSDAFVRDLRLTQELLGRHGIQWSDVKPVPIMLRCVAPADSRIAADMLTNIHSVVNGIQYLEQVVGDWGITETSGPGAGAVFTVTNLELDLGRVTMTSRIFTALHDVLQLGVPVDYLSLPKVFGDLDRVAQISEIGAFMRTLLGVSASNATERLTQVRWIVMPMVYSTTNWFAPFCSALATAGFVRIVHLKNCGLSSMIDYCESDGGFSSTSAMRRHIWSWLAFALLSSASSSSVETLVVDGEALRSEDVEAIQAVMENDDPLGLLYDRTHQHLQTPTEEPLILILTPRVNRQSVECELHDFIAVRNGHHSSSRIGLNHSDQSPIVGVLLHRLEDRAPRDSGDDDASPIQTNALVFVPGFGFCHAVLHNPGTKRARREVVVVSPETSHLSSSSSFRTLRLKTRQIHATTHAALHRLIALIGSRLCGLGIDVPGVSEQMLELIWASCPQLESLAVRGVSLSSMDVFTRAYDHYKLPLSSLDLVAVSVPEREFQRFLCELMKRDARINRTLQRLRFGDGWAHELSKATLASVENVLRENETLTHVKCFVSSDQSHHHDTAAFLEQANGRLVRGLSHWDRARCLAFLGVVRHHQTIELNSHVRQRVLEFAMPPPVQRVVEWGVGSIGISSIPLYPETISPT